MIPKENNYAFIRAKKAALFLREGAVGVIPTDTIYGICGSALNKKTVEKIYKLRKRNPKKPVIILIGSIGDLKEFNVKLKNWQEKILLKIWPAKISVILDCPSSKFYYLHRGTKTLSFRVPASKNLLKIISVSGPLVAPSANFEGRPPAENINEAKKYFGGEVFYYGKRKLTGQPSTLVDLTKKPFKIIRTGADCEKILKLIKQV